MKEILFSVFQTTSQSNGGVNSITQIMEQDKSISPLILTNIEGPFNLRWQKNGWKVFVSNIKWGNHSGRSKWGSLVVKTDLLKSNFKSYKLLVKKKIDILYCNDIQGFWCAYYGGKLAGAKIVFNLRDTKSKAELGSVKKWKYIFEKSDSIVVLSEEMKAFVLDVVMEGKRDIEPKIHITYSIVDLDKFKPVSIVEKQGIRQKLGIAQDQFVISYVATFNEKKAQLAFIKQLISKMDAAKQPVVFNFIGDFLPEQNPYAKQCLDAVNDLKLNHMVRFIGHVDNVSDWYKASDLLALASLKEGLARCMIEGLSCGVPMVSFDVSSAREILERHECGEVVTEGDYTDFHKKLISIINDSDKYKLFVKNAYTTSRKLFSKENVLDKYQAIYNSL